MGWHHNDLTVAAGAPLPSVDEGISAYAFEDQNTQHLIYFGQDVHIRELWWDNNGWHHNDLTIAAGAPLPSENISAYAFEDQGTSSTSGRTFTFKSSGGTTLAGTITTSPSRLALRYQASIKQ